MMERFTESDDIKHTNDISASELLCELTVIDSQRADVRQVAEQIDITDINTSVDLMAYEFGPEGRAVLMIETLEGYVAAIEKQLSVLDSQAATIRQVMAEPLQISRMAGARLKEMYEQKRDIVRQIQDLKRQKDTAANRKKMHDLEYMNRFTVAPREAEAQNDQLHADAVIERLEGLLSVVTVGRNARTAKLAVYEVKIQQLKEKVEKVSSALGMLASATSVLKSVADEVDDWSDVTVPERLQEIDIESVRQLALYGDYSSIDDPVGRQSAENPANISEFSDVVSVDAAYFHAAPEGVTHPDSIHPLLSEVVLKARHSNPAPKPKKSKRIKGFLRIN